MSKDANIIIRIDSSLKKDFCQFVDSQGYSVSEVVLVYIKDICQRKEIPSKVIQTLGERNKKDRISIPKIKKALQEIIEEGYREKIDKAYLFGSYSRGEENYNSDIDIRLVTKGQFTLFDLGNIYELLKEKLNKEIDIVTSGSLDEKFLNHIKEEEICIYE